jgi:hypothetical protein
MSVQTPLLQKCTSLRQEFVEVTASGTFEMLAPLIVVHRIASASGSYLSAPHAVSARGLKET